MEISDKTHKTYHPYLYLAALGVLNHKITGLELIQLLHIDKKSGCEMLYKEYAGMLYGFILRTVKDTAIASDILLSTFATAFSQMEDYDPSKNTIFVWLMNITRNTLLADTNSQATGNNPALLLLFKGMNCEQAALHTNTQVAHIKAELRKTIRSLKNTGDEHPGIY